MRNTVYIVGVGPGSPGYVTPEAERVIREADIVVGWEMNLVPVKPLLAGKKVYVQEAGNYIRLAEEAAAEARKYSGTVAIVKIGDPCLSSGLDSTLKIFRGFEMRIIPGISSTQVAAAAARINLDESVIVSFHESEEDLEDKRGLMLEAYRRKRHLIILTGQAHIPHETAEYLIDHGVSGKAPALVCENLTLDNEKVFRGTLDQVVSQRFSWLSVTVVKQEESR